MLYVCKCLTDKRLSFSLFFFFQAEDGIRDLVRSRGLGDVYKRQPLYMSPEQATAERIDRRSDLFSVGLILYEAVMGLSLIHI